MTGRGRSPVGDSVAARAVGRRIAARRRLARVASAAVHHPTGDYAPFAGCPLSNPRTDVCIFAQTEGGELTDRPDGRSRSPRRSRCRAASTKIERPVARNSSGPKAAKPSRRLPRSIPGGPFEIAAPRSLPGYVRAIFDEFIAREATALTATTEFAAPASAVADRHAGSGRSQGRRAVAAGEDQAQQPAARRRLLHRLGRPPDRRSR